MQEFRDLKLPSKQSGGEGPELWVQPERVGINGNTGIYFRLTDPETGELPGGRAFPFGFLSQASAEALRDALNYRYPIEDEKGVEVPVNNGPLASFTQACDVEDEAYVSVEAADGEIYINITSTDPSEQKPDEGFESRPGYHQSADIQFTADSARAFADALIELADNLDNGVVFDAGDDS
jgi:hypothetical protein